MVVMTLLMVMVTMVVTKGMTVAIVRRFSDEGVVPKKVESLIRFFEPFWISRVFHFFLRTFAKVEGHPEPLGASDETYTLSKIDISGSNETMQNALALSLADFLNLFYVSRILKIRTSHLGEICYGG